MSSILDRLPPGLIFQASTNLLPWLGPDLAYFLANIGNGVGTEAYEDIPANMQRGPVTTKEAYTQAFYFTALAAERAIRLQDQGKVTYESALSLFQYLSDLNEQAEVISSGTNLACEYAGASCPVPGAAKVLLDTIQAIEAANLPEEDTEILVSILKKNRNKVTMRQAVPFVLLFAVGGYFLYSHYRKKENP